MAIKSSYFTGANGKGFKVIIGATFADLPAAASVFPIGSKFIDDATGNTYELTTIAGVATWQVDSSVGASHKIVAAGTQTLAMGTKTIVPGPAVTANSKFFVMRTQAVGGAHAIGAELTVVKSVGVAGVGNFQITAIDEAAGALVAADITTFDWMMIEPV